MMRSSALVVLAGCGGAATTAPIAGTDRPPPGPAPAAAPIRAVTSVEVTAGSGRVAPQWGVHFEPETARVGEEIDLVDCAGWLARARLVANDAEPIGWRIEVIAAAPLDAACRTAEGWPAFAILPADPGRADLSASGGDPAAAFASLPEEVRGWATEPTVGVWAHLDGDGVIDLVDVAGPCKPGDDYTCARILIREGDGWREVGYTTPL